jgi:hypothetical protein
VFFIEECEDPDGTTANLPTSFSGCEAGTLDVELGATNGAVTTSNGFSVYALPDVAAIGAATMTAAPGTCNVAPDQCVIGIFAANPNFGHPGFGYPHLFSAPFQVTVGDGLDQGDNPGDGTPEATFALALPTLALGLLGGTTVWVRRRRSAACESEDQL